MKRDQFSFDGLGEIEARILKLSDEADYLILQDRTVPKQDETLARFDLNEAAALPYLDALPESPQRGPSEEVGADAFFHPPSLYDEDDGDGDGDPEADDDEGADEEPIPPRAPGEALSRGLIIRAACLWIRDVAFRNTIGEPWRRYRVKVYGPKGHRLIDSGQFLCHNQEFEQSAVALPTLGDVGVGPSPSFDLDLAASQGVGKALRALGEYYTYFGKTVIGTMGQLQGINNGMIHRLSRELGQSRNQVEELVASILTHRFTEAQAVEDRRVQEKQGDARTALAEMALAQFGDAAKVFMMASNIPPELQSLLQIVRQNPDLARTLADPGVQALLSQPQNVAVITMMLRQFSQAPPSAPPGVEAQSQPQPPPPNPAG